MGGLTSLILMFEKALYPFKVINVYLGRFSSRFLGGKSKSLSLAARSAIAFFFCFAIFITIAIVLRNFGDRFALEKIYKKGLVDDVLYYLIAAGISILVYWGVRLATLEKPLLYPEIDRCWKSFDSWREKQALDWFDFNRYLVLGSSLPVSKAMHAEMKGKKVDALPSGEKEWMHWFGTTENQYLHLKKITHTNERLERIRSGPSGGGSFIGGGTLQVSVGVPGWSDDPNASVGDNAHTAAVDYGESAGANFGVSLDPNDSIDAFDSGSFPVSRPDHHESDDEEESYGEDDDTRSERIEYLAKMMLSKTEGEVPFHGVVVSIPFDKFLKRENYKSISAAIRKDLLDIREYAGISFPVAIVFTSMEKDEGFPKLQNLLGSQRAATGRFGAGCKVEDIPTIEKKNLELQVSRACNSFEDWVINRWAKSSQLARAAQNKELYKLVIRIRQQFRKRLRQLLEDALVWNPSESPNGEGTDLSLAGCYFVSTGDTPAERGFLSGVFAKCEEFSETSSWSEDTLSKDRVYSVVSSILFLMTLLMIVIVGIVLFRENAI